VSKKHKKIVFWIKWGYVQNVVHQGRAKGVAEGQREEMWKYKGEKGVLSISLKNR
jgi:hypothetical protein